MTSSPVTLPTMSLDGQRNPRVGSPQPPKPYVTPHTEHSIKLMIRRRMNELQEAVQETKKLETVLELWKDI